MSFIEKDDPEAWNEAFRLVWPAAYAAAQVTLQLYLPADVEDVAIETVEELVDALREGKPIHELKPLAASIAHNRAVSRLRQHFAARRGGGRTESLEARSAHDGDIPEAIAPDSPVAALEQKELAERLRKLLAALKPPLGEMLADSFLRGLSYEEIAKKHNVPVNSVGVLLKRGREAMRRAWGGGEK